MRHDPRLEPYTARFAALPLEPLVVDVELGTPLAVRDETPTLDGLLSDAVVREATRGAGLAPSDEPYWLPLPLQVLWRAPGQPDPALAGAPLWAATPLRPRDDPAAAVTFKHRRNAAGHWSRTRSGRWTLVTHKGRYREAREPVAYYAARWWRAWCVGHRATIEQLLHLLPAIGAERHRGYGLVVAWRVGPAGAWRWLHDGCYTRNVPVAAAIALGLPCPPLSAAAPLAGWTPPHRLRAAWLPCWRAGTPVPGAPPAETVLPGEVRRA